MSEESPTCNWVPTQRISKLCKNFGSFTNTAALSSQTSRIANLGYSLMPSVREIVQYDHTTYVDFKQKPNPTRGQGLTTVAFIKNVLSLVQSIDKWAAILCYDDSLQANSICHPSHVPTEGAEFQVYFPRCFNHNGNMHIKCKMTSSISLYQIKRQIRHKLDEYGYFIWPTHLKATRTVKVGWLFQAHPDLTNRGEIHRTLAPLLQEHSGRQIEFQAVP